MPAAGWYADPLVAGQLRYWDGERWTAFLHPIPTPRPSPAPPVWPPPPGSPSTASPWPGAGPWPVAAPQPKGGNERTGPLPLHPMTVADILDGAFKLLRANFRTIAVVVAVLVVPVQILAAVAQRNVLGGRGLVSVLNDPSTAAANRNAGSPAAFQIASVVVALINLLLLPFVAGAIAKIVSASYLGETLPPAAALRATRRRFWSLLGAWWLIHLSEGAVVIAVIFGVVVLAFVKPILLVVAVPLGFASSLGGVVLMGFFVLTAPVIVTEQLGPIRAMRRSWRLVRPRFFVVVGIALLAGGIAQILTSLLGGIPSILAVLVGLRWGWILLAAGNSLVAMFVTPIVAIVATLLYFDARIRTEGFDLEIIAAGLAAGTR